MVLLILASIETCNMVFVRQSLSVAGYESAREASRHDGQTAPAKARGQAILDNRGVQATDIVFDPADVGSAVPGTEIEVTVTAECNANMVITSWFYGGRTLGTRIVMVKE